MIPTNQKWYLNNIALILVALLVYCFAFQGSRGLFEKDEGRYTVIALNMLNSGDWIHPRAHYEKEHWSKPPLTYWAIASSLGVLGHSEFAARFPGALAFFGSILALTSLGGIFLPRQAYLAALIYGTFIFVVTASNMITTDGLLTFCEIGAVACFARAYWQDRHRRLYLLGMWFFFGLAFLTKGPPGLLPLLCIIIFLRLVKEKPAAFRLNWPSGLLLFLIVGGGWYVYVIVEKLDLITYFFKEEIMHRVTGGTHNRNPHPFSFLYIYVPILLAGSLPWTKFLLSGIVRSFKEIKRKIGKPLDAASQQQLFLLLWLLVPLTVFCIARSRLALYVLPLFAPLALFAAREILERNISWEKWRPWILGWMLAMVAMRFAGGAIVLRQDASWYARELKKHLPSGTEEIVFVDQRPILGLAFYTGASVESITMLDHSLEDEMAEMEKRVWILKPEHGDIFSNKSLEAGHPVRLLSAFDWDHQYLLFVEE